MMNSKERVKRSFSERASEWAACYSDREPRNLNLKNLMSRQRFALEVVEAGLPRGSKVLDVGCGPGEMAAKLMQRGYEVWGLDIAEPMICHARKRCGTDRFRVGDIEHIPFPENTFDGVVCLGVLEYLDVDEIALREIHRVLKPGGRAVISTPSGACPLYHLDRMLSGLEPLYDFAKYRLRGKPARIRPAFPQVVHRTYHRRSWVRLLRSLGLEREEWVCYGWGWYRSRLGVLVEFLSQRAELVGVSLERFFGSTLFRRAGGALARNFFFNWICYEQLVRLRAAK